MRREGIDYIETLSPAVRYDSLRVLLATIVQEDLKTVQFHERTAFIHGELNADIRMELPEGLSIDKEVSDRASVVCQLNKSLCGHMTSPTMLEFKVH